MSFAVQMNILRQMHDMIAAHLQGNKVVDANVIAQYRELVTCLVKDADKLTPIQLFKNSDDYSYVYFASSELYVNMSGGLGPDSSTDHGKTLLNVALVHINMALSLKPLESRFMNLFKIIINFLAANTSDPAMALQLRSQVLARDPIDLMTHYNIGKLYQTINDLDNALKHYRTAYMVANVGGEQTNLLKTLKIDLLQSISDVYYNVQDRDTSLYYIQMAYDMNDREPNVNNRIGVLHTELRNIPKALFHYKRAIEYAECNVLNSSKDMMLATVYMNMGLVKCYECKFVEAIECYDKALASNPKLVLAFQNKLLDLNYISHLIKDQFYVGKLHKGINKMYPSVVTCCSAPVKTDSSRRLRIGFMSGDFINHPVSYFVNGIFKHMDYAAFDVYCYNAKTVNLTSGVYTQCKFKSVRNKSAEQVRDIILADEIDILIDLSGHTGDNRLDAFALKPAPVQITYCGYPNTTGLKNMDYRITDKYADTAPPSLAKRYYSEKLLYMKNSFLCYTPAMDPLPKLAATQGCFAFGCFNRMNKLNSQVLKVWDEILTRTKNTKIVFKTKELACHDLRKSLLQNFSKDNVHRVEFVDFKDVYHAHLEVYNQIDVALDPFPYSGTTTSCEALCMGVPVLTLKDCERHYHSQNVTSSLLVNSDLQEYITQSTSEYIDRAVALSKANLGLQVKTIVRNKFLHGHVCNAREFTRDFESLLMSVAVNFDQK